MNIGQLAREAEVPIDTVRYYERNGLLPLPARRASGYRDYQPSDVERLLFVRRAKEIGFTLGEIRELLLLSDQRGEWDAQSETLAAAKLADVDRKLACLAKVKLGLRQLAAPGPGRSALGPCPLLQALADKT